MDLFGNKTILRISEKTRCSACHRKQALHLVVPFERNPSVTQEDFTCQLLFYFLWPYHHRHTAFLKGTAVADYNIVIG